MTPGAINCPAAMILLSKPPNKLADQEIAVYSRSVHYHALSSKAGRQYAQSERH